MIILVIFNLMLLSLGSLNQCVLALQIQSLLRICNGTSSLRIYFCMNVVAIMKNAELEKLFEIDEVLAETPEWFKRLLSSGGQARKEIGHEPELPDGQVNRYDRHNHEEVAARLRLSGIHSHLLGSRKGENF